MSVMLLYTGYKLYFMYYCNIWITIASCAIQKNTWGLRIMGDWRSELSDELSKLLSDKLSGKGQQIEGDTIVCKKCGKTLFRTVYCNNCDTYNV